MNLNEFLGNLPNGPGLTKYAFLAGEYEKYYCLSKIFQPESFLEVGVYRGFGACSAIFGSGSIKAYIGIDNEFLEKGSNRIAGANLSKLLREIGKEVSVDILNCDTNKELPKILHGRLVDWVHIDGFHSKEHAINDIRKFWPFAKKMMTVHDVCSHGEVNEAVKEELKNIQGLKFHFRIQSKQGFEVLLKK